jgi:hypothetical protein
LGIPLVCGWVGHQHHMENELGKMFNQDQQKKDIPSDKLRGILELIIQTGYITDEAPASVLLIAPPASGKSRVLGSLRSLPFVKYVDLISPKLLINFAEQVAEKKYRFLAMDDFTAQDGLSKPKIVQLTSILKKGMEEGLTESDYFGMTTRRFDIPVQFGVIASITKGSYEEWSYYWHRSGFLSRFLPFSFQLSQSTLDTILKDIVGSKNTSVVGFTKSDFFRVSRNIKFDESLAKQLIWPAQAMQVSLQTYPMRPLKILMKLCRASARLNDRESVIQSDVDYVLTFVPHVNYNFKEM